MELQQGEFSIGLELQAKKSFVKRAHAIRSTAYNLSYPALRYWDMVYGNIAWALFYHGLLRQV